MKKKLILVFGVLAAIGLAVVVFGFVFLGGIVKAGVEKVGPLVLQVPVKLDVATLSVFNGSGKLKGFEIGNPEGFKTPNAIKVGTVEVSVAPASVFAKKVVVRSVKVEAPEITFETDLKGNNLSKILANVQALAGTNQAAPKSASGTSKALQVDEFVITGGKVNLSATLMGGKSATLPLPEIRLSNLGQGPEGITPLELTEKAMAAVVSGTLKAVGEAGVDVAKKIGTEGLDAAKKAAGGATEGVKKAGEGLRDMFKKK